MANEKTVTKRKLSKKSIVSHIIFNYRHMRFIVLLFILISCNSPEKMPDEKTGNTIAGKHCYTYTGNRDTIFLNINYQKDSVTGELIYQLYQKDKNKGTIAGTIKNGLLIADYSFMSEGVISVRQVAFKRSTSGFSEGHGTSQEKNGKMVFSGTNALQFDGPIILKEVECN